MFSPWYPIVDLVAGNVGRRTLGPILCEFAQVDSKTFRQSPGQLSPKAWEQLEASAETLAKWPLTVWDAANVSIPQLKAMARVWKSQSIKERGLIVVDYLQLLTTSNVNESRANKVAALPRGTKSIAHDLQLPLIQPSPPMVDLRPDNHTPIRIAHRMWLFNILYGQTRDSPNQGTA